MAKKKQKKQKKSFIEAVLHCPNPLALTVNLKTGGGVHQTNKKNHKKDRKNIRQELKKLLREI